MSIGVLFAITNSNVKRLLAADGDAEVMQIVEKIEEKWDEKWLCELDKAWDALHRCFTDGELDFKNGEYPLNHAILGGKQLHQGDDYIVALVLPNQVADLAKALQLINDQDFQKRYWQINRNSYGVAPNQLSQEDLEYIQDSLHELKSFYAKASKSGRAVLFTVDQ